MRLPGWSKLLLVLAAVVAVGVLMRYTVFRPDPVPVTVYRVSRGLVEETVANSKAGTVKARRRAKISPEIGGRVLYIGARPGARVAQGDILLRINDGDLKASLDLARHDLATARSSAAQACLNAQLAERELKRNLELKNESIVSAALLDQLKTKRDADGAGCEAAHAAEKRAQAAIELAEANLKKT